ncbi:MAG: ThiF family adenylyltransferase [Deltaproteobacteria bacterium]|nr:ThiF family adenylyltransferase [Deltaproteobacteria bacterium]
MDLEKEIQQAARLVKDPAGRQVRVLEDQEAVRLAAASGLSPAAVYETALAREIVPYRYLRNHECISVNDQLRLARSRVAVVGAGGLGGNVILLLAIVVVDSDRFDETNLNRQALSSMETLGLPKAEVAARMVEGINPGVEVIAHTARLDPSNGISLLRGTQVVVDALDNVPSRFALQDAARDLNMVRPSGRGPGSEYPPSARRHCGVRGPGDDHLSRRPRHEPPLRQEPEGGKERPAHASHHPRPDRRPPGHGGVEDPPGSRAGAPEDHAPRGPGDGADRGVFLWIRP